MEAKRGRTVVSILGVGLLAVTSGALAGCELTKTGGADLSTYRTVTELADLSGTCLRGLLSMDVQEDETFDIGSPLE